MSRNAIQFQKGLSDAKFDELYPTEEHCRQALIASRWPSGFSCPACGCPRHTLVQPRRLMQCSKCGRQTSPTAGTLFHKTLLPLKTWFRALHHLTSAKHGMSAMELHRRLDVSVKTASLMHHKLMQAMRERDSDAGHMLGNGGGQVVADDVFLGGERNGNPGTAGKTPLVAMCELDGKGNPHRIAFELVKGHRRASVAAMAEDRLLQGAAVLTDGLKAFMGFADAGMGHEAVILRSTRASCNRPRFVWVNTVIANVKNSLTGTFRATRKVHAQRYLAQFVWRFNRRWDLPSLLGRLLHAASRTPPFPYGLVKIADVGW